VGISWDADGYTVSGEPEVRFGPGRVVELVEHVRGLGPLVAVVDSTNGTVDASLMAAGVAVVRADPADLPPRPAFGSVPARVLADLAADSGPVTALTIATGTIAGRGTESQAAIAACGPTERRLAATGRFAASAPFAAGDPGHRDIAITFDDGPDPRYTGGILDVLADRAVPATFFCVGLNVAGHPDLVARVVADGHEVGNHTWSHAYLPELTGDEVARQIDATNAALTAVTGRVPVLMRPPYGARTPDALDRIAAAGMTTVVWDVDPGDWARPGPQKIIDNTVAQVAAGSIILLHDGGGDRAATVAALPGLVDGLRSRGYRFVPLPQLLGSAYPVT
jgi:peptidoglycan/xylan/chitin deacetylase (PgdA/CDA1 family)